MQLLLTPHPVSPATDTWPALADAVLQTWHEQTHQRAGRQRASVAQLRLGPRWAAAGRSVDTLHCLARRLAADGAAVQVLVVAGLHQPELHLGWAPWHAPPQGARPDAPAALPPHPPGALVMKLPNLRHLFTPDAAPPVPAPEEPRLAPAGQRAAPGPGRQLPQALQRIAEQIDAQEVRHLLDTVDCRFQLWELTLYVTAGNQPALRGLMEVHQRNPAIARSIVERALATAEGAARLNTLRMKLDFKRADSLPRDASEVLVVCGRESVTLPYAYTGQIELGQPVGGGAPQAPGGAAAAAVPPEAGPVPMLVLWGQVPDAGGQPVMQRWQFTAGTVTVGAADDAVVRVNHHHVSGQHLLLAADAQGGWTVEDRSRNGSGLMDALATGGERPLPARLPQPLPAAGVLRLGPLPDDPLLSFHLVLPRPAVAPAAPDAAGRRRVTQLAASSGLVHPVPARATDLP